MKRLHNIIKVHKCRLINVPYTGCFRMVHPRIRLKVLTNLGCTSFPYQGTGQSYCTHKKLILNFYTPYFGRQTLHQQVSVAFQLSKNSRVSAKNTANLCATILTGVLLPFQAYILSQYNTKKRRTVWQAQKCYFLFHKIKLSVIDKKCKRTI